MTVSLFFSLFHKGLIVFLLFPAVPSYSVKVKKGSLVLLSAVPSYPVLNTAQLFYFQQWPSYYYDMGLPREARVAPVDTAKAIGSNCIACADRPGKPRERPGARAVPSSPSELTQISRLSQIMESLLDLHQSAARRLSQIMAWRLDLHQSAACRLSQIMVWRPDLHQSQL